MKSLFHIIRTDRTDQVSLVSPRSKQGGEKVEQHLTYIKLSNLTCKASPPSEMVESVIREELKWQQVKTVMRTLYGPLVTRKGRMTKWSLLYRLIGERPMIRMRRPNELYRHVMACLKFRDSRSFIICHITAAAELMNLPTFRLHDRPVRPEPIQLYGDLNGVPVYTCHEAKPDEILVGEGCTDMVSGLVIAEGETQVERTGDQIKLSCPFGIAFAGNGAEHYTRLQIEPADYSIFHSVLHRIMTKLKIK